MLFIITMSKTKQSGAKHYEVLFIMPNKFTDEESKKIVDKVEKLIVNQSGVITLREYWGKKRLAYEIKHNAFGYYSLFEFDLEGDKLAKIDNSLKLDTDILRHQIVVKKQKTAEEAAHDEKIKAKIDSKKATDEKLAAVAANTSSETSKSAVLTNETLMKKSQKADLKDLDEKLEGILNAKDLI